MIDEKSGTETNHENSISKEISAIFNEVPFPTPESNTVLLTNTYCLPQMTAFSRSISFNLKTLWLFTYSDLTPVIVPHSIAGFANLCSGLVLRFDNTAEDTSRILLRAACMVLWLWLNLLSFNVGNQRLDDSIEEDAINKAWRPLPAKRLDRRQARHLLIAVISLTLCFSCFVGGLQESLVLMVLNWIHNDLGGGDENFWVRDILNALGFICFSSGTSLVLGGPIAKISLAGQIWVTIMGSCVFFTIPVQDLYDQPGDKARNRRTAPLVLGDLLCRIRIAICVIVYSAWAPFYLQVPLHTHIAVFLLGLVVSGRTMILRSIAADKSTFKHWWSAWMIALYGLPLFSRGQLLF